MVLRKLKRRHYRLYTKISEELGLEVYVKGRLAKKLKPEPDELARRRQLAKIAEDAERLLSCLEGIDLHPTAARQVEILSRILYENTLPGEEDFRENKKPQPNRIISAVDPDARHGAKSKNKKFDGYKAHVTETVENEFITNIDVTPGNVADFKPTAENTREMISKTGLEPTKMLADGIYGTGENRQQLKEMGIQLVAPPHPQTISQELASGQFTYDPEKEAITCPAGVTTTKKTYNAHSEAFVFRFHQEACSNCRLKDSCTSNKNGRTIAVNKYYQVQMEALAYSKTKEYKQEIRKRCPIEGTGAELLFHHGLRRARYWGCLKVKLQAFLTALAVNIKRWARIRLAAGKPALTAAA